MRTLTPLPGKHNTQEADASFTVAERLQQQYHNKMKDLIINNRAKDKNLNKVGDSSNAVQGLATVTALVLATS